MTATDELRALLDERGVEHYDGTESTLWGYESTTPLSGRYHYAADEISDGYMQVRLFRITPAQAVEATLGRSECHVESFDDGVDEGMDGEWYSYQPPTWYLSCGHEAQGAERPCFCPVCGRRVTSPNNSDENTGGEA